MNILIIKLAAIGDVIRTTSILPGLREKFPNSSIAWVTKKESFDILKNNGIIEKIFLIDAGNSDEIKNAEYDLIINLDDDYDACKLASGLSRKKIIGAYLKSGNIAYTEDSSLWFDMGLMSKFGKEKADKLKAENKKTYQEIMYQILGLNYKKQEPILILDKNSLKFGNEFKKNNGIKNNDIVIGINTGAGGRWQDKKLSIKETAELADKLNNEIKDAKLILFGGPEEKERNNKIKDLVKTEIIDAKTDNSLLEFASLVNLCDILVTSDSLAMHIATALKKKIVAFFYVTSSTEIELYGRGIKVLGKGKSFCSYEPKCKYPPKWNMGEFVDAVKKLLN